MSASGGISLDQTVSFFWNSVSSEVPNRTTLAKRYTYTCLNSADAETVRGLFPSLILYFQTEEGGSAKKLEGFAGVSTLVLI